MLHAIPILALLIAQAPAHAPVSGPAAYVAPKPSAAPIVPAPGQPAGTVDADAFKAALAELSAALDAVKAAQAKLAALPVSQPPPPPPPPVDVAPANVAGWKANLLKWGKVHGDALKGYTGDSRFTQDFYDGAWCFYQLGDLTGDASWYAYGDASAVLYRDSYVLPNQGRIQPWYIATTGLRRHYERTKEDASRQAVLLIASNAAYAPDTTDPSWTANAAKSREVALNLIAELDAEALGAPHRARTDLLVNQALGHIDQWFGAKTADYMQPFMVGLTVESLIRWHAKTGDPRVPPAVKLAADGLLSAQATMPDGSAQPMWREADGTFFYLSKPIPGDGGPTPAPDLNMLVAPIFGWAYAQAKDPKYLAVGNKLFNVGVDKAFLDGPKQFNQNYRSSFDYLRWTGQR